MAPKFPGKGGGAKGGGKAAFRPTSKPGLTKQTQGQPAAGVRGAFGGRVGGGLARPAGSVRQALEAPKPLNTFVRQQGKGQGKGGGKPGGKQGGKSQGKAARQAPAHHAPEQESPGFKGERQRVSNGRVTGKVVSWKGPFGWIVPDAPIKHPSAGKRGGKIYLDQIDVEQELSGVGARVSFFVYADGAGLGAQHVIPAKGPAVQKTIEKTKAQAATGKFAKAAEAKAKDAKGKGKGKGKKEAKAAGEDKFGQPPDKTKRESLADAGNGTIVDWRGDVGWLKPDEPVDHPDMKQFGRRKGLLFVHSSDCEGELPLINAQVMYSLYKDEHGLGAESVNVLVQGDGVKPVKEPKEQAEGAEEGGEGKSKKALKKALQKSSLLKTKVKGKGKEKGKGKGKGKPAGERGPSGPDLPRERLTVEAITGEVVTWKGKIGWIRPSTPIDDPDASKHGGKLYAHIKDLIVAEGQRMERGMTVQCYVFKDASGLGAEEIVPL